MRFYAAASDIGIFTAAFDETLLFRKSGYALVDEIALLFHITLGVSVTEKQLFRVRGMFSQNAHMVYPIMWLIESNPKGGSYG